MYKSIKLSLCLVIFVYFISSCNKTSQPTIMNSDSTQVVQYINSHPQFLNDYLQKHRYFNAFGETDITNNNLPKYTPLHFISSDTVNAMYDAYNSVTNPSKF